VGVWRRIYEKYLTARQEQFPNTNLLYRASEVSLTVGGVEVDSFFLFFMQVDLRNFAIADIRNFGISGKFKLKDTSSRYGPRYRVE
jgi:hypothetical protein